MEDVKALGEKFVRVCVSVIVYLARGIRSMEAAERGAAGACVAFRRDDSVCAYCIPHTLMYITQL